VGDASVRWETKLRWMVDAARALGAAHDRGLVHRDVKPENIMVRGDGVVKVLDFGIAKRVRADVQSTGTLDDPKTQSVHGSIVGTPWYLSPEQLRGDPVDGRADQFAWAVTTYELITGVLPWPKGVDGFQLVLAIINKTPDPPSKLAPALPAIVDATIMKALAKVPTQRFEVMEFVVNALEGVTSNSRRSWADLQVGSLTKTDPAPPIDGSSPRLHLDATSGPLPVVPTTDEPTTLPSRRRKAAMFWRPVALATVVLAAAAALGVASGRLGPSSGANALSANAVESTPPLAPASARATTLMDLPPPRSTVPEALAAYRAFQQGFRDADWNAAIKGLATADERDPSMAAAQMRLAFMHSLESLDEGTVRSIFHRAVRNRANLDERDAALLDALAPYLQDDPSDPLECARRLDALRARWPQDAELAYVLGSVRYDRGDLPEADAAFDAAARIDPGFALAWSTKGGVLAYMGKFDEARAALEDALRRSRTATEPLWYLSELDEQQGRCVEEEARVRTWLSRDPDDWYAYDYLARALAGQGKPADAVRTALEEAWTRLEPARRAKAEPADRSRVALMTGDFAEAERRAEELEKLLASEPGAQAHAESHGLLAAIAEETGRPDRARAVAEAYLARKDAWAPTHRVDNVSIFLDAVPQMIGVMARTGALTPAQREERRTAWLDAWRAKTAPAYRGYLWIAGWAQFASTRDEGKAAIDALPSFGGLPAFSPNAPAMALVGHAYLLADRTDEAIAALRKGNATCTLLHDPIGSTRGWLDLGTALEQKGDRAGACDAYKVVVGRWGKAKPRSVTAEKAKARSGALACK
jgi:serine/threonine-protein kinase